MAAPRSTLFVLFLLAVGACASAEPPDEDRDSADAGNLGPADDPNGSSPDASLPRPDAGMPPMLGAGIGQACTGAGQGTCPAGLECFNFIGGAGGWCSKRCTGLGDPVCGQNYNGPGATSCFLSVDTDGVAPPYEYMICGVLCQDFSTGMDYCPTCNGTCPGAMQCTSPVANSADGSQIATSCE